MTYGHSNRKYKNSNIWDDLAMLCKLISALLQLVLLLASCFVEQPLEQPVCNGVWHNQNICLENTFNHNINFDGLIFDSNTYAFLTSSNNYVNPDRNGFVGYEYHKLINRKCGGYTILYPHSRTEKLVVLTIKGGCIHFGNADLFLRSGFINSNTPP